MNAKIYKGQTGYKANLSIYFCKPWYKGFDLNVAAFHKNYSLFFRTGIKNIISKNSAWWLKQARWSFREIVSDFQIGWSFRFALSMAYRDFMRGLDDIVCAWKFRNPQ